MKHATTRLLFSYWDSLRGERAAPERSEIEPAAIRRILADTFILELEPGGRPAIRLAGTRICAFYARELRSEPFEGLWGRDYSDEGRRLVEVTVDDAVGVVAGLVASNDAGEALEFELITLPLRHRGRTHARVLGALSPGSLPLWIGERPLVELRTVTTRIIRAGGRPIVFDPPEIPVATRPVFVVHEGGRVD